MGGGFLTAYNVDGATSIEKDDDIFDNANIIDGADERDRRRRREDQNNIDKNNTINDLGGGYQTNKVWIYNGNKWEERKPMSIARDRPACSIVNMPNGEVDNEASCNNILNTVLISRFRPDG